MELGRWRSTRWAPLGALVALASLAWAALAADAVPDLPDDRVAVAPGVPGNFEGLGRFVGGFESEVGAEYAVCVVRFSDPHNRSGKRPESTVQYVDQVFASWRGELDPERHVVIALSTENRGIAIHPGTAWAALGFEQGAITKVIDRSPFAVTARAGNIPLALERLIHAVDLHLSIQLEQAQARAQELRSELDGHLRRTEALEKAAAARAFDTGEVAASLREARSAARQAAVYLEAGDVRSASRLVETGRGALGAATRSLERLDAAQREIEHLRATAPEALREVGAALEELEARLRDAPYDASTLLADAAGLRETLDETVRTVLPTDPVKAGRQARNLHKWVLQLQRAEGEETAAHTRRLERIESARTRRNEVEGLIEERAVRLADAPFANAGLQPMLDEARGSWERGGTALDAGDPESALVAFQAVELKLANLDAALVGAERDHHFRTVLLPRGLAGAGALVLLLLLVFHWRTRRSRRLVAERLIAHWDRMLGRAGTRLVKLRDDHPHLFGSRRLHLRFEGETATAYREVGEQVDDLFVSYGNATLQLKRAQEALAAAGAVGWAALDRAAHLLGDDEIEVRREAADDRQLFLPETEVVTRRAEDLLEHMGEVYEGVYEAVGDLQRRILAAPRALEAASGALAESEEVLAGVEQTGLYADAYEREVAGLVTRHGELATSASSDPIGSTAPAEALRSDTTVLRERITRVNETAQSLRELLDTRLPAALDEVRRVRREERLRLQEPGFEPDAMFATVRASAEAARRAIEAAEEDGALAAARQATATLDELGDLVARTIRSRDETPGHLDGLREEERRLRERLPERRERLAALASVHADEALQPALDNAEEALEALDFCAGCIEEARAALAPEAQCYLAGAELARRALDVLRTVSELYDEIETRSDELDRARDEAAEALDAATRTTGQIDALIAGDVFASAALLEEVETLRDGLEAARTRGVAERPDWLACRDGAQALATFAGEVLAGAREEHAAFASAMAMQVEVEKEFHRIQGLLASSDDDRAPANQRLSSARSLLSQTVTARTVEHPDWAELLVLLEDTRDHLVEAERRALDDFWLASAARDAVAAAEDAIDRAGRHYGLGVKARLVQSRNALSDALDDLSGGRYESALENAETARDEAEDARRAALRAVRNKQRLLTAGVLSALGARRRRSRRGSFFGNSSSGGFFSGGGSSFGSGFGSSSGGSSFGGGGFSGGSSFGGSSSGGSSFGGSSSGGSSW